MTSLDFTGPVVARFLESGTTENEPSAASTSDGEDSQQSSVDPDREPEHLVEHCQAVTRRACRLGRFGTDGDPSDRAIERCITLLHDAGKDTPMFQQYVRGKYQAANDKRKYTFHARLGALATFHALSALGADKRDALAGWAAVLKHHGRLPNLGEKTIRDLISERDGDNNAYAATQVKAIDQDERCVAVADELLQEASNGATDWATFRDAVLTGSLWTTMGEAVGDSRLVEPDSDAIPATTYDRAVRFWGALCLADKTAAADAGRGKLPVEALDPKSLSLTDLEDHVATLQRSSGVDEAAVRQAAQKTVDPTDETSLNALREAARRRVRDAAPRLATADIGTLTLPTGVGKTFSGLTGAFVLRDDLQARRDREAPPVIVYALPYTSIIEQTRAVFEDEVFGADPTGRRFTPHHSLTETVTYLDTEGDVDGAPTEDRRHEIAELLGESWRSGVVLTTFVQLFESLAGPTNARGLKLPALQDAVIILDEPQALPKRWWAAVRRLTRTLVEEFDASVISMTATQPELFNQEFDTVSLLNRPNDPPGRFERRTFESLSRITYRIDDSVDWFRPGTDAEPIAHDVAGRRVAETALDPTGIEGSTSVLAVCNTVASSRELADAVETATERPVERVGSVYQNVLADRDDDPTADHPNPRTLAIETLNRLGFAPVGDVELDDVDAVADIEWRPETDVAADRLVVAEFSARYRPIDRRAFIAVADALSTAGSPFAFVSTRAIEAGVDLSFGRAYRDLAPLDSIAQTAGRCNRSFEWGAEGGIVTVWCLGPTEAGETDDTPANLIYSRGDHLRTIASILDDATADHGEVVPSVILEREAVQEYFDWVDGSGFADASLAKFVDEFKAESLGRASLIGDDYSTVDLLVAETAADRERIEALRDLFVTDPGEAYSRLDDLAGMRVSIRVGELESELPNHLPIDHSGRDDQDGLNVFAHTGNEGGGSYELDDGGFVVEDDDVESQFTF